MSCRLPSTFFSLSVLFVSSSWNFFLSAAWVSCHLFLFLSHPRPSPIPSTSVLHQLSSLCIFNSCFAYLICLFSLRVPVPYFCHLLLFSFFPSPLQFFPPLYFQIFFLGFCLSSSWWWSDGRLTKTLHLLSTFLCESFISMQLLCLHHRHHINQGEVVRAPQFSAWTSNDSFPFIHSCCNLDINQCQSFP